MKKTISILALMTLFSTYCLAYDNIEGEPTDFDDFDTELLLIHAIDCNEWIDDIPVDIEPIHLDPAGHLDLRFENMDWTNENFHFNYLLQPCSDEACFRQASLRFRQQTGQSFSEIPFTPYSIFTWIWCFETSK